MFMKKTKSNLKKFGFKSGKEYFAYSTLSFGEVDELLREAKKLNRLTRKMGDREYAVFPVAGPATHAVLVVGHY